jgi:hypothetical protein
MRSLACLPVLALCACGGPPPPVTHSPPREQPDTGAIEGRVTDIHHDPLTGATVAALRGPDIDQTSPNAITDKRGSYHIDDLAPGVYEVVVFYANVKYRHPGNEVRSNKTTTLDVSVEIDPYLDVPQAP